jgi:hypothetical protein
MAAAAEAHHVLVLLQVDGFVEQAGGKLLPGALVLLHLIGHRFGHAVAEVVVAPGATRTAQHRKLGG